MLKIACYIAEKRHQKELQFRIVGAIENNNYNLLQELINKGVNTNATILLVKTPLIHALEQWPGNFDIIAALVSARGTDINLGETTPWGKRPLHYVAANGSLDLCKLFIEGAKRDNCDIDICDSGKATPVHHAARYGHIDVVKYLIKHGCDVNTRDDCGRTALHRACENQHKDVAIVLIEAGADVNAADKYKWTPVFHAIFFGYLSVVEFLIKHGADVHVIDMYGNSLLHIACYNAHSPIHEQKRPEDITLRTSFDYYQRKRKIPTTEFQNLLLDFLDEKISYADCWMFEMVKLLVNSGIDPKLYPTDDLIVHGMSGKQDSYCVCILKSKIN